MSQTQTRFSWGKTALRFALAASVLTPAMGWAQAPAEADRSEMEAKKKAQEEARQERERLKAEAVKETSDQREARLRAEAKVANAQAALGKAQEALKAAARRQNRVGQTMMVDAWMLDPTNMDYPFNAGAFAEANGDAEAEFWALSGFMSLALRELEALGPSNSDYKATIEERVTKARTRLDILRKKVSNGQVDVTTVPADCEIYLDGAYLGKGKGSIETITGQRRIRTDCMGFKPLDQFLNVRAGDANAVVLRPVPVDYYGYLMINYKPTDGVTIFLDDIELEKRAGPEANAEGTVSGKGTKLDPLRLSARKWIIRFEKPGHDRWHRRIEIRRDQITIVNAVIEKMSDNVESSGN